MVKLKLDQALVHFINHSNHTIYVWKQYKECFKCPLVLATHIPPSRTSDLKTNTNYELEYALTEQREADQTYLDYNIANNLTFCRSSPSLGDQSISNVIIRAQENSNENHLFSCEFAQLVEGRNNIWPIVGAVFIFVLIAAVFYIGRKIFYKWRERWAKSTSLATDPSAGGKAAEEKKRRRLKSLDCFRGITILMMIFVNMGAGGYEYLGHATWDGFNFADIIFPWFIFIMGTTMAISFKSAVIRQKTPVRMICLKICKRSLNLFIIGLMLNSNGRPDFRTLRVPGVLQRFAVSYLVVASAHVLSLHVHKGQLCGQLRIPQLVDLIPYWSEWIIMSFLGFIYFTLTYCWTFDPNCPKGYIGQGGLSENRSHPYCTGGAANYIDRWLLGEQHIYNDFTGRDLYDPEYKGRREFNIKHDPVGVLGSTNSIILTFLGLQFGKILTAYPSPKQRIIRWLIWGTVLACLCALIAGTGFNPINKNLWSFSYICLTASTACFALSLLYYTIDVIRIWPNGQPFQYPGMNSILLYIGHEICSHMIPWRFNVDESSHIGPLASNLVAVSVWFIVSVVLAKKRFFLTV